MNAQTQIGKITGKNVFLIINQQITPLTKDVTRLGRQLDNDVVFQEESVSRNHAEILCEQGKYILHDYFPLLVRSSTAAVSNGVCSTRAT